MNKPHIIMVTGLQPYGHYSTGLCQELSKVSNLTVLAENDIKNNEIKDCGNVVLAWDKSVKYIFQILKLALINKTKVVHVQHEIRMYGNNLSAALFPFLLLGLKLLNKKVITTVHAVVAKDLVKTEFIKSFTEKTNPIYDFLVKNFFIYLYKSIYFFSNKIIVHSEYFKNIYINDYKVSGKKIFVLPIGVNTKPKEVFSKKSKVIGKYFWYYGYLAKRKGLENIVNGFLKFVKKANATDIKLVLSGGTIKGQEFAAGEIKDLVEKSGFSDQILITGYIDKEDIETYAVNAYATIVPAKFTIAGSGPLAHLFSYHKCIMASKVGALVSELDNGKTGLLVNNDKWDNAFEKLYKNPNLVKQFENQSKLKADSRRWNIIVNDLLNVYRN